MKIAFTATTLTAVSILLLGAGTTTAQIKQISSRNLVNPQIMRLAIPPSIAATERLKPRQNQRDGRANAGGQGGKQGGASAPRANMPGFIPEAAVRIQPRVPRLTPVLTPNSPRTKRPTNRTPRGGANAGHSATAGLPTGKVVPMPRINERRIVPLPGIFVRGPLDEFPFCFETDEPGMVPGAPSVGGLRLVPCRSSGNHSDQGGPGIVADRGIRQGGSDTPTDELCKGVLAKGPTQGSGGRMPGEDIVGNGRGSFDWGAAIRAAAVSTGRSLIDAHWLAGPINRAVNPDPSPEASLLEILGSSQLPGASQAAAAAAAIGDGLKAGIKNNDAEEEATDEADTDGNAGGTGGGESPSGGQASGGGTSQPEHGPDRGVDSEQALYDYCKRREEAQAVWRWLTDATRHKQPCRDPKSQPTPASAENSAAGGPESGAGNFAPWCEEDESAQADGNDRIANPGAGEGRDCGPMEQPDADGKCSGRPGSGPGYSPGMVGTLQETLDLPDVFSTCDPRTCDPATGLALSEASGRERH